MIKVRNHPDRLFVKQVVDGDKVIAEYWFDKTRIDRGGRVEVKTSGEATYADGSKRRLDDYCFAADVARAFRDGVL